MPTPWWPAAPKPPSRRWASAASPQRARLSTRNDDPQTASRPWDRDRDGFVLGEGAGVLVLEELEHASKRGARIYGELIGFGMSADAFHITSPDMTGPYRGMRNALRDAKVNVDEVQYVNAHGTSTADGRPQRDRRHQARLRRRRAQAGGQLHQVHDRPSAGRRRRHRGRLHQRWRSTTRSRRRPSTSSTRIPSATWTTAPTRRGRCRSIVAISNSFGFGGTNGTLVIRKFA